MTTPEPSTIEVCETACGELAPRAAIAHVILMADRLFSGGAALDKAIELRRLVEAFGERGIPRGAIVLAGASLDVSTGVFTRSSSVRYRVRVRLDDLDRVPDALDVIANAKQATLTHLEWEYPSSASDALLAECVTVASAKARVIAAALGVPLGGVHEVRAEPLDAATPYPDAFAAAGIVMARKRATSVPGAMAGLELAPAKTVGIRVHVVYRLDER